MFIVFEGIDGSGKSSCAIQILNNLKKQGHMVFLTHEPSNSIYGKQIRELFNKNNFNVDIEIDLLIKDRKEHLVKEILPAIQKGFIVISDRYYFSHVYQSIRGYNLDDLLNVNKKFALRPDLTIIFDLPHTIAYKRLKKYRKSLDCFEKNIDLKLIREEYLKFRNQEHVEIINASLPKQKVIENVERIVRNNL